MSLTHETKFRCVVCGRLTTGWWPREGRLKGDGSARWPRRHRINGQPCPGNTELAEWVDVRRKLAATDGGNDVS